MRKSLILDFVIKLFLQAFGRLISVRKKEVSPKFDKFSVSESL